MLLSTILISFVTFFTSVTTGQQIKFGKFWDNLGDSKWFKESSGTNDVKARASRYDWTGTMENPECPGNVLSLHPGEGTRISSHKSYGKKAYPDNYKVRYSWKYFCFHRALFLLDYSDAFFFVLCKYLSFPTS